MENNSTCPIVSAEGGNSQNNDTLNVNTINLSQTFANVVSQRNQINFKTPDRDQGILFDSIDGCSKNSYILGLGKIVSPKNILFASRVSNGRICIFLSSKTEVDNFITNHRGINIDNVFVPARRLVSPTKYIILPNVSPCIPNYIILDELKREGLKTVSQISLISAGISDPEYKHIMRFRRQVYIAFEENTSLPSSILLRHQGLHFRIFITEDEVRSFNCKELNHIASKCPKVREQNVITSNLPLPSYKERVVITKDNDLHAILTEPNNKENGTTPNAMASNLPSVNTENCKSLKRMASSSEKLLSDFEIHVAMIAETWLKPA